MQIGDSIVDRLRSSGLTDKDGDAGESTAVLSRDVKHEVPQVTVYVQNEPKPVIFRGDSSDKYSVSEWVDITKACLRRQNCKLNKQADEILSRLMGKARDMVTVALRSKESLDVSLNPDLIYDILIRYFSESSSCLPLEDFYTTLPMHREGPVDY